MRNVSTLKRIALAILFAGLFYFILMLMPRSIICHLKVVMIMMD